MNDNRLTQIQPPEPLTPHEQKIRLVKCQPPRPLGAYLLLAAITSLGGFVMGWVYLVKDGKDNKLFGLGALLLGFLLPLAIAAVIIILNIMQIGVFAPLPEQPGVLLP